MSLVSISATLISPPFWLAAIITACVALIVWSLRLLSSSGAISAFVVGSVIFGVGGGKFTIPLLVFFLSSSLLSKLPGFNGMKAPFDGTKQSVRDAWQVLANALVPAALIIVFKMEVHHWPIERSRTLLMLILAAFAAVNADTWATEIGRLTSTTARLLTNWHKVSAGASGAITTAGTIGSALGAAAIPLSMVYFWRLNAQEFVIVTWAGFLGALVDSLLGASLQAQYRDPASGEISDSRVSGSPYTGTIRGFRWINNNTVNFLSSVSGVLVALFLIRIATIFQGL